jgi:anaerobic ribonucleoside-triphosphate reductase activating protein
MIQVGQICYPVTALGYGQRVGIWLQGCSIRCAGCLAKDTWEPNPLGSMRVVDLVALCATLVGDQPLDGVTITGGEPTDQADSLGELVSLLRHWLDERPLAGDIMCYTGRTPAELMDTYGGVAGLFDVVVAGPFVGSLPSTDNLTGSGNQEVLLLTSRGRERYMRRRARRRVQLSLEGDALVTISVPRVGDLPLIARRLRASGVEIGAVSWAPVNQASALASDRARP